MQILKITTEEKQNPWDLLTEAHKYIFPSNF